MSYCDSSLLDCCSSASHAVCWTNENVTQIVVNVQEMGFIGISLKVFLEQYEGQTYKS